MKDLKKLSLFNFVLILSTFLSYIIGILIGNKFLLPVLNISFSYPFMVYLISRGKRREALKSMLIWALSLIIFGTAIFSFFPEKAEITVINGKKYRDEMFEWIRTGVGRESNPKEFIPQHLLHISIFIILSFISSSFLSILMGSVMVNYMNFYVSQLIFHSKNKIIPILLGWHFWSLIRVFSFVILGVLLSEPLLCFIKRRKLEIWKEKSLILISIAGLILDIILKTLFAPLIGNIFNKFIF